MLQKSVEGNKYIRFIKNHECCVELKKKKEKRKNSEQNYFSITSNFSIYITWNDTSSVNVSMYQTQINLRKNRSNFCS